MAVAATGENSVREGKWSLVRVVLAGQEMKPLTLFLTEDAYEIGRLDGHRRLKITGSGFVSKKHCKIHLRNGIWRLEDMGSMNGTFLNGVRVVEEREMRHGDMVGLGVHQLSISLDRPYEAYFIFRFVQAGTHIAIPVIPAVEHPTSVKKEVIEEITIDSDDEELKHVPGPQIPGIVEPPSVMPQQDNNLELNSKPRDFRLGEELQIKNLKNTVGQSGGNDVDIQREWKVECNTKTVQHKGMEVVIEQHGKVSVGHVNVESTSGKHEQGKSLDCTKEVASNSVSEGCCTNNIRKKITSNVPENHLVIATAKKESPFSIKRDQGAIIDRIHQIFEDPCMKGATQNNSTIKVTQEARVVCDLKAENESRMGVQNPQRKHGTAATVATLAGPSKADKQMKPVDLGPTEEEQRREAERRIAKEQYDEIVTGLVSHPAELNSGLPEDVIENMKKRQAELTKRLHQKWRGSNIQDSSAKKYRRIISVSSSSSSDEMPDEVPDEMGYLDHSDNPYVVSSSRIQQTTTSPVQPSPQMAKLFEKVRQEPPKILITPVISFAKRGGIAFSLPREWKKNLDLDSFTRATLQFQASCSRNNIEVPEPPVSGLANTVTRKRKEPEHGEELPTPKKIRTETLQEFSPSGFYSTGNSSSCIPESTSAKKHESDGKIPRAVKPPQMPPYFQTKPWLTSNGIGRQENRFISNDIHGHPEGEIDKHHSVAEKQAHQVLPQNMISARPSPQPNKPPTQKDYAAITNNIRKKLANSRQGVKMIPPVEHSARKRTANVGQSNFPAKKGPIHSRIEQSSSSNVVPISIKERLQQLAAAKKQEAEANQRVKAPAPKIVKTTKTSRLDLLISDFAPTTSASVAAKRPEIDKSKIATIAPLNCISNALPSAVAVEDNVVESIIRTINKLSVTSNSNTERPLPSIQEPASSERNAKKQGTITSTVNGHGNTNRQKRPEVSSNGSSGAPAENTKTVVGCEISSSERLPEDQVYRDTLMWNAQWLKEQSTTSKPPPVVHNRPMLTNLPFYKDYESYKNTFYPLMLLELWAAIFQDSKTDDFVNQKNRQGTSRPALGEIDVGMERKDCSHYCPMLLNPNQPLNPTQIRLKEHEAMGKANTPEPFYHCFKLVALVDKQTEINRELDFGTVTFDFKRSTGDVHPFTFFAFFQDPQYEQINSMTVLPPCMERYRATKKFKVTLPAVTHIKYDVNKIVSMNICKIRKISYISSKIRDFRALAQLPDSTLFRHILNPPKYTEDQIMRVEAVPRSELIAAVHQMLNPVQRSVVHHISRRITNIQGADMMFLHGPAGTGKTRTIVALLLQLTLDYRHKNPGKQVKILVCTPSNTAVDEIIRRLTTIDDSLKIVRIGGGSVSQDTRKFMLEEAAIPYLSSTGQVESINQSIAGVDRKIEEARNTLSTLKDKNSTVASALEANIAELQRDRQMYVTDLNTVKADRKGMEQAKRSVIVNSQVVFSTLNSCSSGQLRRQFKRSLEGRRQQDIQKAQLFTCCIVDESTQTTEPESLAPLMLGCEKLILVGDPKQLPATVLSVEAENKKFRQSLFTRIFNHYEDKDTGGCNPVMMLTIQYRMHREILKWPNEWFYGRRLETHPAVDSRPPLEIRPYLFLNIDSKESNVQKGQISNNEEVKFLKEILKILDSYSQIYPNHRNLSIGVITPYNEQRKKVCEIINEIKSEKGSFKSQIEVDTVDSFQGREKDIILFSCVRTCDLGFVKTPERLNVALTRARQSLVILGNANCLNVNTMWRSLMNDAKQRGHFHTVPSHLRYDVNLSSYIEKVLTQKPTPFTHIENET